MRPCTVPYNSVVARQLDDVAFEPEEEALSGSLPHDRNYFSQSKEEEVSQKFWRMVREMRALKAVKRSMKPKKRKNEHSAHFEHVQCHIAIAQMCEDIARTAEQTAQHQEQTQRINKERVEQVADLSNEVCHLRSMLQGEEDDLLGGSCEAEKQSLLNDIEVLRARVHREQVAEEAQLQQLKADADAARQEMRQAQREAADVRAKLTVQEEVHKQELGEMRKRVAVNAAAASEEELQDARGRARELQSRLRLAHTEREERESLLEAERVFHQQEIKHLQGQIARARQESQKFQGQKDGQGQATKTALHKKSQEAEEALSLREEYDASLAAACNSLHKPASELLALFGLDHPDLKPPQEISNSTYPDLSFQARVIKALASSISQLHQLLESRVAQHA
jgi:hypothetical protein